MNTWAAFFLSVLRIASGLLFIEHGTQKVLNFPSPPAVHDGPAPAMVPFLHQLAPYAGYIELIGGALLLLGVFTRVVAFILSGEMAFAYFGVHNYGAHDIKGFFPILNGGELAALYSFVFLYFCFAGGGSLGFDAVIRKKQ